MAIRLKEQMNFGKNFGFRHSGLDPESSLFPWIPAFAGMTDLGLRIFMQCLAKEFMQAVT
jgi:hypothetical protein